MDVDVAACWRPSAANYWGTVTKAHIASIAKDMVGEEFADERAVEKKGEAAAAMELAFGDSAIDAAGLDRPIAQRTVRWLPKGMAFEGASVDDALIDGDAPPVEASAADAGPVPAFLEETEVA